MAVKHLVIDEMVHLPETLFQVKHDPRCSGTSG